MNLSRSSGRNRMAPRGVLPWASPSSSAQRRMVRGDTAQWSAAASVESHRTGVRAGTGAASRGGPRVPAAPSACSLPPVATETASALVPAQAFSQRSSVSRRNRKLPWRPTRPSGTISPRSMKLRMEEASARRQYLAASSTVSHAEPVEGSASSRTSALSVPSDLTFNPLSRLAYRACPRHTFRRCWSRTLGTVTGGRGRPKRKPKRRSRRIFRLL
jgi:hypothetical protein